MRKKKLAYILLLTGLLVFAATIAYSQDGLKVDANGNVGIGTTTPQALLHVNGSGIQVNANNNEVYQIFRDLSGVATLQIESDTNGNPEIRASNNRNLSITDNAGNGIIIVDGGRVGIGITSPLDKLHVNGGISSFSGGDNHIYIGKDTSAGNYSIIEWDSTNQLLKLHNQLSGPMQLVLDNNSRVGIGRTDISYPLHMASGAHVTAGGVWTNASSRQYKENIRDLSVEDAILALKGLKPTKFTYKADDDDEYLGFIAEDVPELVATKDRKGLSPMDIVAVLTKVVQAQQKEIEALKAQFNVKK